MAKYERQADGSVTEVKEKPTYRYTPPKDKRPEPVTNRLFVYGIFLGQTMRNAYGMTNPQYATVKGYVTIGHHIVQATYVGDDDRIALTGLTVDVEPDKWEDLDRLEGGYDRVLVTTTRNEQVYMYVAPERE
jgi:hypothetical protein